MACPIDSFRYYQGEAQSYKKLINLIEKSNDIRE